MTETLWWLPGSSNSKIGARMSPLYKPLQPLRSLEPAWIPVPAAMLAITREVTVGSLAGACYATAMLFE